MNILCKQIPFENRGGIYYIDLFKRPTASFKKNSPNYYSAEIFKKNSDAVSFLQYVIPLSSYLLLANFLHLCILAINLQVSLQEEYYQ